MKEIKFRVIKDGKIVGYETVFDGRWWGSTNNQDWGDGVFMGEGLVREQYTNLKDALGDELYAGDIFEDDDEWFRIGWSQQGACWLAISLSPQGETMDLGEFAGSRTCFKQGNVWENPDMLKEVYA